MKLNLTEILQATNAEVLKNSTNIAEFDFSTDTRTIKQGEIYIPLKGETFDGENFIENALKSGANGYFTSDKTKIFTSSELILYVKDTKEAYLQLANFYKNKIKPYTIAITGSSGKTTVKEMMYSVFKNAGNTVKSILNHNNEIGLCQTLSSLEKNTQYLIVEMGMRGFGEIELLSKYAQPDIAIIVNSGSAHIGRLGSLLNIAKAKFEISKYLDNEGVLIAHDNPLIKQINDNKHKTIYFSLNDKNLVIKDMTSDFSIFEYKGHEYRLNTGGEHNIQNALSVIEAGLFAKLSPKIIEKGLKEFSPIEKRWDVQEIKGFKIINDSYNSNPESVKAALKTFLSFTPSPKSVVLGDMGELGLNEEEYHIETGKFLEQFNCDYVLTIGELAKLIQPKNITTKHFDTKKDLALFIKENLPQGSNILLKASRFMKFEEIIEELSK
jgi:UDP-N-acetylmuramoyl-tripeptide--D-alanyl-D-alanine ligase